MSERKDGEQSVAGFNGGYNPDGTWRWHVFNPNASPLEKKQVELDCMVRLKRIQEERTTHWRSVAERRALAIGLLMDALRSSREANDVGHSDPKELNAILDAAMAAGMEGLKS